MPTLPKTVWAAIQKICHTTCMQTPRNQTSKNKNKMACAREKQQQITEFRIRTLQENNPEDTQNTQKTQTT